MLVVTVESQTSQPTLTNKTLTNQTSQPSITQTENQNSTNPLAANETQTIPHVGKFINGTYAYYHLIPDEFSGSQELKNYYYSQGYRPVFQYLKFKGNVSESANGTAYPAYDVYFANVTTGTIQKHFTTAVFDGQVNRLYVKSFHSGFVWEIVPQQSNALAESRFLVDAVSGQLIGYYSIVPGYV